jgi:hypothetical protein
MEINDGSRHGSSFVYNFPRKFNEKKDLVVL